MKTSSAHVADRVAGGLERTPLQTSDGVAFVYVGEADHVDVVVMEDRFPEVGPLRRIQGSDVWYIEVPLDPDGTIEYKLAVSRGGKRRLILDPTNPERSNAPFGSNSIASGPEYRPPIWLAETDPAGTIEPYAIESSVWGHERTHRIFIPHDSVESEPWPLLVLHDGPEYVRYAGFKACLDWLIGMGQIPPMAVLLHQPHARNEEYVGNPLHSRHLFEEVLPAVSSDWDIGPVYAGGASLGAVASLSAAHEAPGAFEGLMLQSGSFVSALGGPFRRGPVLRPVTEMLPGWIDKADRLPERLVFSCGTYDGLVEDHRTLIPALSDRHGGVSYQEINAGHHWRCWRDALESDLSALLQSA
ncbi:MAG TPA: alpha/beta hydrolase-fold protein [Acidimicrobiia bacterium]